MICASYYFGIMFAGFPDQHDGMVTSGAKYGDKGETAEEPPDGEAKCETCFIYCHCGVSLHFRWAVVMAVCNIHIQYVQE
jgi:hypothetical protein